MATLSPPLVAECKDTSEKIDLFEKYSLYIKPIARLNITIQLPPTRTPGQTVSVNEILDKVRKQCSPDEFIFLRVIKSTLEFIRCEAEIENKSELKTLLAKLDGSTIKMSSFTDVLKVRAAETKISYPTRHDWETFFKDDSNPQAANETFKPGERPDTIHVIDLPCKWFASLSSGSSSSSVRPCEEIVKEVFSMFGEIRQMDIPMLTSPILLTQSQQMGDSFELFVQYKDYISFVKAMDAFRGMKILRCFNESEAFTASVRVDFDRTRHLSDKEMKKREIDKLKAIELEKIKTAQQEKEKDKEAKLREINTFHRMLLDNNKNKDHQDGEMDDDDVDESKEEEKSKEQRRREREEVRRQKRMAKKQSDEERKLEQKILLEERKILIAQRKLESMRLLEELFNRVKVIVSAEELAKKEKEMRKLEKRRLAEQETLEFDKIKRQKQEESELKEKVEANLARLAEEEKLMAEVEEQQGGEMESFELRKDTLNNKSESKDGEDADNVENFNRDQELQESMPSPGQNAPKPRAVLLQKQQMPAKLYEEDSEEKEEKGKDNHDDDDKKMVTTDGIDPDPENDIAEDGQNDLTEEKDNVISDDNKTINVIADNRNEEELEKSEANQSSVAIETVEIAE